MIGNCRSRADRRQCADRLGVPAEARRRSDVLRAVARGRRRRPRGVFAIDVHNLARVEQRYLRNTAMLESLLHDSSGNVLRIVDFCPRFRSRERFFRPMMFMRLIEPLAGRPIVTIRFRPSSAYGAEEPSCLAGSHHLSFASGVSRYRLTTDASLRTLDGSGHVVIDRPLAFVIGPDEPVDEAARADAALSRSDARGGKNGCADSRCRSTGRKSDPRRDHAEALHV